MATWPKENRTAKYYTFVFLIFATVILYSRDLVQSPSPPPPKQDNVRYYATPNANCTENLNNSKNGSSFSRAMARTPWKDFKSALSSKKTLKQTVDYFEAISDTLIDFIKKTPPVPLNDSCGPQELSVASGFNCTRLQTPRKVGVLLLFAFEVDALEIHLNELDAVVDKFFIVESTVSHNHFLGVAKKLLLWDQLRRDERFKKFQSKVVHFVMDEAITATRDIATSQKMWRVEDLQDELRWRKFQEWNAKTGYFSDDDFLGFGHADEIPHRDNIYTLKHCKVPSGQIDIGIWFPAPYLDNAFRSDWPVPDHPYTIGSPTYWTVAKARRYFQETGKVPKRMKGKSPAYFLGGIHLSCYSYPPFLMLKRMSCTECTKQFLDVIIDVGTRYGLGETKDATERLLNFFHIGPRDHYRFQSRSTKISDLVKTNKAEVDAIVKLPWFIKCNPGRYPTLRGNGSDLRLEGL